ncbi:hypothetical protein PInf_004905 [Phytophthora infestans]|nr:hypothetical protein PInf_004877 [Phytophthora infestans]KAI9985534.1 hypothetical protein PInf_004905 [Phytophthora infestans]
MVSDPDGAESIEAAREHRGFRRTRRRTRRVSPPRADKEMPRSIASVGVRHWVLEGEHVFVYIRELPLYHTREQTLDRKWAFTLYHNFFARELPFDHPREPLFDRQWETTLYHVRFSVWEFPLDHPREPLFDRAWEAMLNHFPLNHPREPMLNRV